MLCEHLSRAGCVRFARFVGAFNSRPSKPVGCIGIQLPLALCVWCAGRQRTDGPAHCMRRDLNFIRPRCTVRAPTANGRAARADSRECVFGRERWDHLVRTVNRTAQLPADALAMPRLYAFVLRRLTFELTGLPKAGPVE